MNHIICIASHAAMSFAYASICFGADKDKVAAIMAVIYFGLFIWEITRNDHSV